MRSFPVTERENCGSFTTLLPVAGSPLSGRVLGSSTLAAKIFEKEF